MAGKARKKNDRKLLAVLLTVSILLVAVSSAFFILMPRTSPLPTLGQELDSMLSAAVGTAPDAEPGRTAGSRLSWELQGELRLRYRSAYQGVTVRYLDVAALTSGLESEMQTVLQERVGAARLRSEVYGDDRQYLPSVLEEAYGQALEQRLARADEYMRSIDVTVRMDYSGGRWVIRDAEQLRGLLKVDSGDRPGYDAAAAKVELIDFHYSLPDWTSPGPVPDPGRFGVTQDPSVVAALLETYDAQALINGQTLDWSAGKELIPGSSIYYYLDETILSIVWQEEEHGALATFAEVFIADASQLRRKLADDEFGVPSYYFPTVLSAEANAVLAVSGDFYNMPDRVYGVYAYNGQVMRSNLYTGQTCFFTDKGDMIFSYDGQFGDEYEAQAFVDENRIMFSLSFGPVIYDHGVDVVPSRYPLGEINDAYARCVLGQMGERHYLAMTINVRSPDYFNYVTLRQAADSIIAHGCYNAYTLDGGQTGSIIVNGALINPVQYGRERAQSDIIYFATAIPN